MDNTIVLLHSLLVKVQWQKFPTRRNSLLETLFSEAVKASSLNKEGHSFDSPKLSGGSSLNGKLQQIMKQEKEMEIEITKKLQGGIGPSSLFTCLISFHNSDASSYVDIKIVSRHLERKLIVCKCSVIDLPGERNGSEEHQGGDYFVFIFLKFVV
ncbi:hypothetical protein Bca52824_026238 [Brassica carinata]|uniref:Uncharacterized protein n=1 Tax=Brassica carinata TaxID=52824 RepID=A0A8X7SJD4_BRACI|nr:hypothetical protein Bca52824_026238 [Brassica carinata]